MEIIIVSHTSYKYLTVTRKYVSLTNYDTLGTMYISLRSDTN